MSFWKGRLVKGTFHKKVSDSQDTEEPQRMATDIVLLRLRRKHIQVGRLLGSGSFAKVFQVSAISNKKALVVGKSTAATTTKSCHGNDKNVAIKVLNQKLSRKSKAFQDAASDLMAEAKILMRCCGHPFIIQLRGLPQEWEKGGADALFLVLDKLDETLDRRILQWRQKSSSSSTTDNLVQVMERTRYALQIVSALKFLHAQRIVYRDLKPENIGFLADPSAEGKRMGDKIQLFDLGLCRELPSMAVNADNMENGDILKTLFGESQCDDGNVGFYEMKDVAGSPRYMAGEIRVTGGYCNLKCDIYSWAVTFYEMLSLKAAFEKCKSMAELREAVWKGGNRPSLSKDSKLRGVPSSIKTLLKKSWSKHPTQRPSSAECCQELERILVQMDKQIASCTR